MQVALPRHMSQLRVTPVFILPLALVAACSGGEAVTLFSVDGEAVRSYQVGELERVTIVPLGGAEDDVILAGERVVGEVCQLVESRYLPVPQRLCAGVVRGVMARVTPVGDVVWQVSAVPSSIDGDVSELSCPIDLGVDVLGEPYARASCPSGLELQLARGADRSIIELAGNLDVETGRTREDRSLSTYLDAFDVDEDGAVGLFDGDVMAGPLAMDSSIGITERAYDRTLVEGGFVTGLSVKLVADQALVAFDASPDDAGNDSDELRLFVLERSTGATLRELTVPTRGSGFPRRALPSPEGFWVMPLDEDGGEVVTHVRASDGESFTLPDANAIASAQDGALWAHTTGANAEDVFTVSLDEAG